MSRAMFRSTIKKKRKKEKSVEWLKKRVFPFFPKKYCSTKNLKPNMYFRASVWLSDPRQEELSVRTCIMTNLQNI